MVVRMTVSFIIRVAFQVGAESNLDKIVNTGYKALQLEYFFTAGEKEVKAWTIQVKRSFLTIVWSHCYLKGGGGTIYLHLVSHAHCF